MINNIFIFFFILSSSFQWEKYGPTPIPCNKENCFTKSDLIQKTLEQSLETKLSFQNMLRAKKEIKVKLGQILPHMNMDTIAGIALCAGDFQNGIVSIVASFLGILMPSRWFAWKEKKIYYHAQKYSYFSLKANSINIIENMFYLIQREKINLQIYNHYLKQITKIKNIMKKRFELGLIIQDELIKIKIIEQSIITKSIQTTQNINEFTFELLYSLSYDPNLSWIDIDIITDPVIDYNNLGPIDPTSYIKTVQDISLELKTLHYLYLTALQSRRTKKYDFLSLSSDEESSLGAGYNSLLKIKRSEAKTIKLRHLQAQTDNVKALHTIGAYYNKSISMINLINKSLELNETQANYFQQDFDDSRNLSTKPWLKLITERIELEILQNTIVHTYLVAKSNLRRILLNGEDYQKAQSLR